MLLIERTVYFVDIMCVTCHYQQRKQFENIQKRYSFKKFTS